MMPILMRRPGANSGSSRPGEFTIGTGQWRACPLWAAAASCKLSLAPRRAQESGANRCVVLFAYRAARRALSCTAALSCFLLALLPQLCPLDVSVSLYLARSPASRHWADIRAALLSGRRTRRGRLLRKGPDIVSLAFVGVCVCF